MGDIKKFSRKQVREWLEPRNGTHIPMRSVTYFNDKGEKVDFEMYEIEALSPEFAEIYNPKGTILPFEK